MTTESNSKLPVFLPTILTPPPLKTAGVSQAAPSVTFFPRHCSCSSIPLPSPHVDLTYF